MQTALSSADTFHWFSKGWGQLDFLSEPHFAPIDLPVMAGLIAMIVQLYFTWRILVLSTSVLLCSLIGAISVAQFVAAIISGIQVRSSPTRDQESYQAAYGPLGFSDRRFDSALRSGGTQSMFSFCLIPPYLMIFLQRQIWLAGAALSDTLIAISMCYFASIKLSFQACQPLLNGYTIITALPHQTAHPASSHEIHIEAHHRTDRRNQYFIRCAYVVHLSGYQLKF